MRPYPVAEEVLGAVLRVAMPRAVGGPAFVARHAPRTGDEGSSPCLRKSDPLEAEGCPDYGTL